MSCWFKGHRWFLLSWYNYMDDEEEIQSHTITLMCRRCKKTKVLRNFAGGHLNEEFLKSIGVKFYQDEEPQ